MVNRIPSGEAYLWTIVRPQGDLRRPTRALRSSQSRTGRPSFKEFTSVGSWSVGASLLLSAAAWNANPDRVHTYFWFLATCIWNLLHPLSTIIYQNSKKIDYPSGILEEVGSLRECLNLVGCFLLAVSGLSRARAGRTWARPAHYCPLSPRPEGWKTSSCLPYLHSIQ